MSPPKQAVVINPADMRPPPNGDRALTQSGQEWADWVEAGFRRVVTAINTLAVRQDAGFDDLKKRFGTLNNTVLQSLQPETPSNAPRPRAESWEEITGVQTIEAAKDAARDFRERFADERARAERAEAELAKARADDQTQIDALRADNRNLLKWFRIILVTFIVAALGGGGALIARGGASSSPLPYEPHWTPGP